jgi:hypothetical protein
MSLHDQSSLFREDGDSTEGDSSGDILISGYGNPE